MWLTAPKGATSVNQTSATDWQMADWNMFLALHPFKSIDVEFLNQICYFLIKFLQLFVNTVNKTKVNVS